MALAGKMVNDQRAILGELDEFVRVWTTPRPVLVDFGFVLFCFVLYCMVFWFGFGLVWFVLGCFVFGAKEGDRQRKACKR